MAVSQVRLKSSQIEIGQFVDSVGTGGRFQSGCLIGHRHDAVPEQREQARSEGRGRRVSGCRRLAGFVADAANGHHDLGVREVSFDLGAETLDVDVDEPGVGGIPEVPDLFEERRAAEDLLWPQGQGQE